MGSDMKYEGKGSLSLVLLYSYNVLWIQHLGSYILGLKLNQSRITF